MEHGKIDPRKPKRKKFQQLKQGEERILGSSIERGNVKWIQETTLERWKQGWWMWDVKDSLIELPDDLTCITVPRLGKMDRYGRREVKSHQAS